VQFSKTITFLKDYYDLIQNKNDSRIDVAHQYILRLLTVIGELSQKYPQNQVLSSTFNTLANISKDFQKKSLIKIKEHLKEMLGKTIEIEQEEFDLYYPKIKILYEFIIRKHQLPSKSDYSSIEISDNEINTIDRLILIFLEEGEPKFELEQLAEEIPENQPKINLDLIIRGKNLNTIMDELKKKYLTTAPGDLTALYFSDLIIKGGYNFTEANQISHFLESQDIMVIRESEQFPNLQPFFKPVSIEIDEDHRFLFLDWLREVPLITHNQFKFCKNCGLPLVQGSNNEEDQSFENCEICRLK
jgi:hypothetical protein